MESKHSTERYNCYCCDLGKEISRIRKTQGISIEKLSEITKLHSNTISCVERGLNDIKLVTNARIMAALGCSSFCIEETTFGYIINDNIQYTEYNNILKLSGNIIVSMTGNTIREERIKKKLKINELSILTGLHSNTIWNIENGLVEPTLFNLFKIHKALKLVKLSTSINGLHVDV